MSSVSEMDAEFSVESSDAGSVNYLTSFFLSCMRMYRAWPGYASICGKVCVCNPLIIGRMDMVRNINHHLWLVDIFCFLCSVACAASGRVNRVFWLLGAQVFSISSIPWIHRMLSPKQRSGKWSAYFKARVITELGCWAFEHTSNIWAYP